MFNKILIANRGEIAVRVMRTCQRLGVATVAVYSEADADALFVRMADQALPIGGSAPADSYLRIEAVLAAAQHSGAEAIHPGYGFLSENAEFADAVEAAGLVFIGPRATSMRQLGSKAGAKELMQAHGVPVVPGYTGADQDPELLAGEAERIGYPLMIKAAHGGGGKGMRVVHAAAQFAEALRSCQREAKGAFGRERVLLERYVERPRHIEMQIFGDRFGQLIHLNERECSAQRRYQKVLEESPSLFLDTDRRAAMGAAAVAAGRAVGYQNAGTVEFIVGADGDFYFMEINTRLQVEHPVTEMVTGLDLVEWQLRVAAGEALPLGQQQIVSSGHAIELRLYAEDAEQGFLPGSGRIERLRLPQESAALRIDAGVIEGDTVSIFYDPMIAKLIVHASDRPAALAAARAALAEIDVIGVKSNVRFLEQLIRHPAVVEARIDTGFLDRHLDQVILPAPAIPAEAVFAAATAALLDEEAQAAAGAQAGVEPNSPWARPDAWRIGHAGKRLVCFEFDGEHHEVGAHGYGGRYQLHWKEQQTQIAAASLHQGWLCFRAQGAAHRVRCRRLGADWLLFWNDQRLRLHAVVPFAVVDGVAGHGDRLLAPMPGRIVALHVALGDVVTADQELLVMEAMKMEITLRAPVAGSIAELGCEAGAFVAADQLLLRWEAAGA
ncbi:MAG: biotin carboxylase N-terminal domain-containing protein [Lysobacterales bacterium]